MFLYSGAQQDKLSMLMHVLSHNLFQFRKGYWRINATSTPIANVKDLETSGNFKLLRGLEFPSADEHSWWKQKKTV